MRQHSFAAVLLLCVAGCTGQAPTPDPVAMEPVRPAALIGTPPKSRLESGFASLPDRGDLVSYPEVAGTRRNGPAIWHQAHISEAHALHAVVSREMTVSTPGGRPVRLAYQRHVEHPNGNWTWIGRTANGRDAIVTFGEKAVFGTIPLSGGRELRLTTSGGKSWVVESDPAKVNHPRGRDRDYLIPPELAGSLGPAMSAMQAESATASSTNTIDVVLGYTTAIAARHGGDSQAVTRMQFLVDVANQAFANSQLNAQVRLVRAMSVNYPDATDNGDALQKLTGYKSESSPGAGDGGPIAVDPAFTALRSARDQYGGDLVSLVRAFRAPESGGCGIAWLIGGGQSSINSGDAPFGYSVTADGDDVDEGDNREYGCRLETFAHELGHNAGQAHNVEDSGQAGAHSYSYGYREASSTGFYTVMAYRLADSRQRAVRYFANPNVLEVESGRPTGVANSSDNVRSLVQTIPLIASFRATVVATPAKAKSDLDGDGRSDLIWYRPADGLMAYWIMAGATIARHGAVSVGGEWRIIASADFSGDGRLDLIWNRPAGDMQFWTGDGAGFAQRQFLANYPAGWELLGPGDVDGDGRSDLLWFRPSDGRLAYWIMNGAQVVRHGGLLVGGEWRVIATGDFNGDGRLDLIWNRPAGDMQFWAGDGVNFSQRQAFTTYPFGWNLQGAQDIDGDGRTDLVWYRPADGRLAYWVMNGASRVRSGEVAVGGDWRVLTIRDFNGDQFGDLIWNRPAGDMQHWAGDGAQFAQRAFFTNYPGGWELIPTGG